MGDLAGAGKLAKSKREKLFKLMRILLHEEISDVKAQLLNLLCGDMSAELLETFIKYHGVKILRRQINEVWSMKSTQDVTKIARNHIIFKKCIDQFDLGAFKLLVSSLKLLSKLHIKSNEVVENSGLDITLPSIVNNLSFINEDQVEFSSRDEFSCVQFETRSLGSILGLVLDFSRRFLGKWDLKDVSSVEENDEILKDISSVEENDTPESPADCEKGNQGDEEMQNSFVDED